MVNIFVICLTLDNFLYNIYRVFKSEYLATINLEKSFKYKVISGAIMSASSLDVQKLKNKFANRPELLKSLSKEFEQQVEDTLQEIQTAFEAGDHAKLQSLAHTLKGNAGLIGFTRVHDLAFKIEQASANGDNQDLKDSVQNLGPELQTALDSLHDFIYGDNL